MATQTTDQQNALKDAMARAKEIAAKLQQHAEGDVGIKRVANDFSHSEPMSKKPLLGGVDHNDPKVIAQQVANSLARRNLGPMLVEEVTIPSKIVGLVIGKGGEMINKLQTESGAKVQVAPDPPPEMSMMVQMMTRQITITGPAEAVAKAKALLAEIQSAGKVPDHLMMGNAPGEFSVEMNVSKQKVGLIIGKGGETIKNLQERASCKIVLFQDGAYQNTPEKLLRITGEQSAVMYAKQLVQDLLTSKELESINTNKRMPPGAQDGTNYVEMDVPREAVGLIIGAKGANIQQLQNETGCRIQFKNEMQGPTKTAMLTGSPEQVAAAQEKINEIIKTGGPRGQGGQGENQQMNQMNGGGPRPLWGGGPAPHGPGGPAPHGPGGPAPHGPGGPAPHGPDGPQNWGPQSGPPGQSSGPRSFGNNRSSNPPPGHKNMIIKVPANKCGFVIGKGGETIKAIKNESKVNIQIDRSIPETSPFRMFRMTGTDETIQKAVSLIREKIQDPSVDAEPEDGSDPAATPWSAPAPWAPQSQQNQQWNQQQQQQQQWGGQQQQEQQQQQQPGWGQQQPHQQQQGGWNQQSQQPQQQANQAWNQQQPGQQQQWNQQQQQQQQQQSWNQQQQQPQQPQQPQPQPAQPQQWQQQNNTTPGQWGTQQQQWGQTAAQGTTTAQTNQQAYQQSQSGATTAVSSDPTQAQAGTQQAAAGAQPDYSAAWALYYQQQQQYYQQYYQQQQTAAAASTAPTSAAAATVATTPGTTNDSQAAAMAQYQAQLAQYQKQYGQAPQ